MRRTAAVLALALALPGCAALKNATTGPQASQKALATACNAYASALATAAGYRAQGKLSASQVHAINNAVSIAHPVCNAKTMPTTATALAQVEAAASRLTLANRQVKTQ